MSGHGDPALAEYVRFARRHFLIIGLMTALGLIAGVTQATLKSDTYTAMAQVFAPATPVHPGLERKPDQRLPREVTIDTETQILRSNSVITRLSTALDVSEAAARDQLVITVPANTRVLSVAVTGSSPARALAGVDITTDAYLSLRQQIVAGVRQRHLEALQSRIGVLETRLASMSKGTVIRSARARGQRQSLIRQINDMERQVSELQRQNISDGEVVRAATAPKNADRNNDEVPAVSYAALGMLVGVGFGIRGDRARRRSKFLPQSAPR